VLKSSCTRSPVHGSWCDEAAIDKRHRDPDDLTLSPIQVRLVRDYIQANLACSVRLAELADQVRLSPHYFSALFKHSFGIPPHHYVLRQRIEEAQRRLVDGSISISDVALSLGFSDQSHFSQTFRKVTGTTPKQFQRSTRGAMVNADSRTDAVRWGQELRGVTNRRD